MNAEKIEYMFVFQNTGNDHDIKIANISFESVTAHIFGDGRR